MTAVEFAKAIGEGLLEYRLCCHCGFWKYRAGLCHSRTLCPASEFKMDEEKEWDPASLMKEPEPDEVKIWEPIVAIVFTFIALSIFNFNPQLIGIYTISGDKWTSLPSPVRSLLPLAAVDQYRLDRRDHPQRNAASHRTLEYIHPHILHRHQSLPDRDRLLPADRSIHSGSHPRVIAGKRNLRCRSRANTGNHGTTRCTRFDWLGHLRHSNRRDQSGLQVDYTRIICKNIRLIQNTKNGRNVCVHFFCMRNTILFDRDQKLIVRLSAFLHFDFKI